MVESVIGLAEPEKWWVTEEEGWTRPGLRREIQAEGKKVSQYGYMKERLNTRSVKQKWFSTDGKHILKRILNCV